MTDFVHQPLQRHAYWFCLFTCVAYHLADGSSAIPSRFCIQVFPPIRAECWGLGCRVSG